MSKTKTTKTKRPLIKSERGPIHLYNCEEAAEYLSVDAKLLMFLFRAGHMPPYYLCYAGIFFDQKALDEFDRRMSANTRMADNGR